MVKISATSHAWGKRELNFLYFIATKEFEVVLGFDSFKQVLKDVALTEVFLMKFLILEL